MADNVRVRYPRLTARQRMALAALMSNVTIESAAKACNLSARQIYRLLNTATFARALQRAQSDTLAGASRRLASLAEAACDTLEEAMRADAIVKYSRLRAADVTLSHLIALKQALDFEVRLANVEGRLLAEGKP